MIYLNNLLLYPHIVLFSISYFQSINVTQQRKPNGLNRFGHIFAFIYQTKTI